MPAQHSSETGEWYTPAEWIELVLEALGTIDFDPCTSDIANEAIVRARIWAIEGQDSLAMPWHQFANTVFVNPPGACRKGFFGYTVCGNPKSCSCRLPRKFLEKTIAECALGMSAIYLAYSVNQLRQLSCIAIPSGLAISVAMPPQRIAYINPETMRPQRRTNCDSAFILISDPIGGASHRSFADIFARKGCATYTRREC